MRNITGLGHVAIKVKDVDRSLAFYTNVLELPEMLRLHHEEPLLFAEIPRAVAPGAHSPRSTR